MVDVQYMWDDVDVALRTLHEWKDLDVFFCETPLQIDDLAGYARLHHEAPMPIAAGEWKPSYEISLSRFLIEWGHRIHAYNFEVANLFVRLGILVQRAHR